MHNIRIIYDVSINKRSIKAGLDSQCAVWYDINFLNKDILSPLTYNTLILKGYNIK